MKSQLRVVLSVACLLGILNTPATAQTDDPYGLLIRRPGAYKIQPAADSTRIFAEIDTTSTVVAILHPGPEAVAYDEQGPFVLVAMAGYGHRGYALKNEVKAAESPFVSRTRLDSVDTSKYVSEPERVGVIATRARSAYKPIKDPQLAVVLSIFMPGAGHLYAGETGRGAVLFLLGIGGPTIGTIVTTNNVNEDCTYSGCDEIDMQPLVVGLTVGLAAWLIGMVDAGPAARRANGERILTIAPAATGKHFGFSATLTF